MHRASNLVTTTFSDGKIRFYLRIVSSNTGGIGSDGEQNLRILSFLLAGLAIILTSQRFSRYGKIKVNGNERRICHL